MTLMTDVPATDRRMTEAEAAAFLGVKPQTLAAWRCTKRYDLPFYRIGARCIRYRASDLARFLERRRVGGERQGDGE